PGVAVDALRAAWEHGRLVRMSFNRTKPGRVGSGLLHERPCAVPTGGRTSALPATAQNRDAYPRAGRGSGCLSTWYNPLSAVIIAHSRHSDKFGGLATGGGGGRWRKMNEKSARCIQPGSMPSTPAIWSACSR